MRVAIVGASGQIGGDVAARLRERAVDVVAAHRAAGVDAYTGDGLADALSGADVVVDCVNVTTQRAKTAIDFFGTVAGNIAGAAADAKVDRVICLSIINAANPAVNAKFGYYQGKAAAERVYQDAIGDRLTLVRSAQWYELAQQMMGMMRLGPVAVVPHMRCQPLSVADAATALADAVTSPPAGDIAVAGPEVCDLTEVARAIAARTGSPRKVFGVNFGGAAIRNGGLVPERPDVIAPTTLAEWIEKVYPA
ncbi:NAD(P)H-binding protein [Gordonia sp. CPCC 205515]|uniref:SDR family oxidoreductase n=1 Tax=Gordonia sp. CPCC 205515 TaxID=3140791 RepID=UPI003AF367A0